jgi:hypothetical protein
LAFPARKSFTALPIGALGAYLLFSQGVALGFHMLAFQAEAIEAIMQSIRFVFWPSEAMNAYQAGFQR